MATLPRGRGANPVARKAAAPKPVAAPKETEGKSRISEATYNEPEPVVSRGADDEGFSARTSGRHHGAVMALADAVGHHGASITEAGMSESQRQGMSQLERVYDTCQHTQRLTIAGTMHRQLDTSKKPVVN